MSSFQERWSRRTVRQTRFIFILFEIVATAITGSALLDNLFGLGWGYDWKTFWIGLGLIAWGFIVYAACKAIFDLSARSK